MLAVRLSESANCSNRSLETNKFSGGNVVGVTPVPIPNTEVKPYRADGTAPEKVWESRSPPGLIQKEKARFIKRAGFLFFFLLLPALSLLRFFGFIHNIRPRVPAMLKM